MRDGCDGNTRGFWVAEFEGVLSLSSVLQTSGFSGEGFLAIFFPLTTGRLEEGEGEGEDDDDGAEAEASDKSSPEETNKRLNPMCSGLKWRSTRRSLFHLVSLFVENSHFFLLIKSSSSSLT